ncbi:hypothetical protein ACQR09_16400 [Bradyrhizobium oligotrophicum]|uniref:hypothetical protein n=1 Tax=Bradyrhizobium oligotrophicum TaxID=44255 RepID=UPI003EB771D7
MHRSFILVVGITSSAAAFAHDHPSRLHGTYAMTGASDCIQNSASIGFDSNFLPKGPVVFFATTVDGVMVFRADGTGTVNNRSFTVDVGEGTTSDISYQITYTIDPAGKLSVKAVPGTYSSTTLTGPNAGLTQVVDVADTSGFIGEGARAIVLAPPAPSVLTVSRSNGTQFARICNGSLVMTRISGDDR